jgi:tRNA A-37 threonylcarbamoyl transferase component Bud32
MLPGHRVLAAWTSGRRAAAYLLEDELGRKCVLKRYRPGHLPIMIKEMVALRCLARFDVAPQLVSYEIGTRTLVLTYVAGERVLEWVLRRYGDRDLDFASAHGLATNEFVQRAFARFRSATDEQALALREAIVATYRRLHQARVLHGDPGPRNIIYDGERAYLIDFDQTRPSLSPARIETRGLKKWYGIDLIAERNEAVGCRL